MDYLGNPAHQSILNQLLILLVEWMALALSYPAPVIMLAPMTETDLSNLPYRYTPP
jgi:hypothetical protein